MPNGPVSHIWSHTQWHGSDALYSGYRQSCSQLSFTGIQDDADIRVHIITKSLSTSLIKVDYATKYPLTGSPIKVNFNKDLNEKPENIYEIYYPIVARRIVENCTTRLPKTKDGFTYPQHTSIGSGIVIKIVIDGGGYKPQYLLVKNQRPKGSFNTTFFVSLATEINIYHKIMKRLSVTFY